MLYWCTKFEGNLSTRKLFSIASNLFVLNQCTCEDNWAIFRKHIAMSLTTFFKFGM